MGLQLELPMDVLRPLYIGLLKINNGPTYIDTSPGTNGFKKRKAYDNLGVTA